MLYDAVTSKSLASVKLPHLLVLIALGGCGYFGASARSADADHYHANCVGHGLVHGSSATDGSFHSRVEPGCGDGRRECAIVVEGTRRGAVATYDQSVCNAWSNQFGSYRECLGEARVLYVGTFSEHDHRAHNWCG